MKYLKGTAKDFNDLIDKIVAWITDSAIHGADVWELMRKEPWPRGTILKAPGFEEGEHQYIGLMPADIVKGNSYRNWLLQDETLLHEFAPSLGLEAGTYTVRNGSIVTVSKDPVGYYYTSTEIFEKSAKVIFLGVFKQYSDGLNWDDQAGAIKPVLNNCDLTYSFSKNTYDYPLYIKAPTFPGVGYPAIGCDYIGFIDGYCDFWVIKDRHKMILVVKNCDKWDTAYLGFLDPYHKPHEYPFPACVVGGTSGVIPTMDLHYAGGNCPGIKPGIRFDYTPNNWQLSHGLPTHAGIYYTGLGNWTDDAAISQVQLMFPDGTWQSFANWGIMKETIAISNCSSCPTYYFGFKYPQQPEGLKHIIRPTFTNVENVTYVYDPATEALVYQTEPIELVGMGAHYRTNMYGKLWNLSWISQPIQRYGEQKINGKLHIILPNGWENRRFHINHGLTFKTDGDYLLNDDRSMYRISNTMNCVVRLEE